MSTTSVAATPVVKIGRIASAQISIDSSSVSRMHAVIEASESGELTLIDLGSSSGTYLNGQRITKSTKLKVGDRVYVGEAYIEVGVAGTLPAQQPHATAAPAGARPTASAATSAAPTLILAAVVMVALATGIFYFLAP